MTPPGEKIVGFVHITGRASVRITAGSIALVAALALTGCTNPLQGAIDEIVGSQASSAADKIVEKMTNGEVQGLGSSEVPADFPASVPLPDRQPTSAVRIANDDGISWMIQFAETSGPAETESLGGELVARGFTEDSNTSFGDAMSVALYTNADLTVSISTLGDDGDRVLQILVMQLEGN